MEKYFTINESGCSIRCKLYYNDMKNIGRVVVCGHGFGGHKDNKAVEKFSEFVLKKYKDVAVVTYDEPGHGDDARKKLTLKDCETYIGVVTAYAERRFGVDRLYGYANSFGGYQFLKYIKENGSPFYKTALRCPAVNMYKIMTDRITSPDELKALANNRPIDVGFDRLVRITNSFLDELKENDITAYDYTEVSDSILIIQGTKDEIVSYDAVKEFSEKNGIRFVPVEDADHRFIDPKKMDAAIKSIIEFFEW